MNNEEQLAAEFEACAAWKSACDSKDKEIADLKEELAKAKQIPEEYVLVPIEPTADMLNAIRTVIELPYNHANYLQMFKEKHTYVALLAAAPKPE